MEQKKSNFFMVDNTVFYVGLKPRDIAVYCFLCRMENREKGYAYPTRRQIAYACGISKVETVDLALKELAAMFGISVKQASKLLRSGEIESIKIGREYRIFSFQTYNYSFH